MGSSIFTGPPQPAIINIMTANAGVNLGNFSILGRFMGGSVHIAGQWSLSTFIPKIRHSQEDLMPEGSADTQDQQTSPLREKVQQVLDMIRPAVQSDGGDLELVDVDPQGNVMIRFHGACVGCPSSTLTLQSGIERNLKEHVPGVNTVQAVD